MSKKVQERERERGKREGNKGEKWKEMFHISYGGL